MAENVPVTEMGHTRKARYDLARIKGRIKGARVTILFLNKDSKPEYFSSCGIERPSNLRKRP